MSSFALSSDARLLANPRGDLAHILGPKLTNWLPDVIAVVDHNRGCDRYAYPRAVAALALIDDALQRLERKTCERAQRTRSDLQAQREPIAAAVEHVTSLGADFKGPLAQSLISRMTTARDARELEGEILSALTKLAVPSMPDPSDFAEAKRVTAALESLPAQRPRAVDVHAAIEQGMRATPRVAALWISFETKADHPLIQWRAQALAESANVGA